MRNADSRAAAEQNGEQDAGPRAEECEALRLTLKQMAGQPQAVDAAAGQGRYRFEPFQHNQWGVEGGRRE
jgi:hypothetical protein